MARKLKKRTQRNTGNVYIMNACSKKYSRLVNSFQSLSLSNQSQLSVAPENQENTTTLTLQNESAFSTTQTLSRNLKRSDHHLP